MDKAREDRIRKVSESIADVINTNDAPLANGKNFWAKLAPNLAPRLAHGPTLIALILSLE